MNLTQYYESVGLHNRVDTKIDTEGLFPTPLFRTFFYGDMQEIMEYFEHTEFFVIENSGKNMQSKNSYILEEPAFAKLKLFITQTLDKICANELQWKNKLRITQSWTNCALKGQHHHPHKHPNSILSGVFFFKTNSKHPPITFMSAKSDQCQMLVNNYGIFTQDQVLVQPVENMLLIFPSTLMHYVSTNNIEQPRVSLSFNTFAVDSLGEKELLTYLDLPRGNHE
jgi:uncharacterized protein (TIGR02466 family)